MERAIRWHDYITINAYWFAITTRAQVLTPLVIPLLVQQFVGEEAKGTYVGIIRLWALMVAVLVQALMGLLSDHSTLRWGRRRPFIVFGTLGGLIVLPLIGLTSGLEGMAGYRALFALYILSMVASDTAHAATQGLIPDLVPEDKRGRFSGVKALLELPAPLVFVSLVVGRMISAGNLWGTLLALMAVLVVCMAVALFVPEQPLSRVPGGYGRPDWGSLLRLLLMTGTFTLIILGLGAGVSALTRLLFDPHAPTLPHPHTPTLPHSHTLLVGVAGLAGMGAAIVLGVWASVRISVGQEARDHRSFTWWVVNRMTFLVAATSLSGFMLYFLQERLVGLQGEKAASPAATAMMFVGVFLLLSALPSGWLSDRYGKKPVIVLSSVLAAAGMFVVMLVPDVAERVPSAQPVGAPIAIYVGGCMIGAAIGLFYPANWALGTQVVPRDQAGRYLGLSNLASAGAGAIGGYIGGPIADHLGYTLLFIIYGMLFLLSALALKGIQEQVTPAHLFRGWRPA